MADYRCRVSTHGQSQLELSLLYPVLCNRRHVRYLLDLFIFTPGQLGLTEAQYGVKRFLQHLQSYTRYTPPSIPLSKLIDPDCDISPLNRIRSALADTSLKRDLDCERVMYELRTLVNVYHAELRGVGALLKKQVRGQEGQLDIGGRIVSLVREMDAFLEAFRALHKEFVDPRLPASLREGLRWADEAISLNTEKEEFRLYDLVRDRPDLAEIQSVLHERLGRESEYRCTMGYLTQADPHSPTANELFLYREALLKKWAQGAMYMTATPSRVAARVVHVLAGIAAAVAMAFAVVATFVAGQFFPSYTAPWAILIVIAYIFKDRIKEVLRGVLISRLPRIVADQTHRLIDPALQTTVGSSRCRVRFITPADVPEAVRHLRDLQGNPFRAILPQEHVIHFHKEMDLNCLLLAKNHTRLESITEILRLKLDSWLTEMDDPNSSLSCMSEDTHTTISAKRVYHVNLVLRLSRADGGEPPALFKHRVVLSREGIVRIEHMERLQG